jgi:hypothetical protein
VRELYLVAATTDTFYLINCKGEVLKTFYPDLAEIYSFQVYNFEVQDSTKKVLQNFIFTSYSDDSDEEPKKAP